MERGDTDLSKFLKDKATSDEGISPQLIMYYWTEMLLAVKSIHDNSKYQKFYRDKGNVKKNFFFFFLRHNS